MLKFNMETIPVLIAGVDLNTSYVKVQFFYNSNMITCSIDLNTSYVKVQ